MFQYSVSFVPSYCTFWLYIVSCYSDGELLLTRIHMSFSLPHLFMAQHPSFKLHTWWAVTNHTAKRTSCENHLFCSQLVHHNVMHQEYCRSLAFGLYNSFSQSFPFFTYHWYLWPTQVGWCAALLLRIVVRPLCQISYWSRHRPVTIDILCSVGTVAFARFRCACLPLFGLFHNLEPSKLEGCRLALRRCVKARCQDVECFSTLSVLCLVIALSDCI